MTHKKERWIQSYSRLGKTSQIICFKHFAIGKTQTTFFQAFPSPLPPPWPCFTLQTHVCFPKNVIHMSLIRLHLTHQIVVCSELFAAHEASWGCLWSLQKALSASFLRNRKLHLVKGKWNWKCWQWEGRSSRTESLFFVPHGRTVRKVPLRWYFKVLGTCSWWNNKGRAVQFCLQSFTVPLWLQSLRWLWNGLESQEHIPDLGHQWSDGKLYILDFYLSS